MSMDRNEFVKRLFDRVSSREGKGSAMSLKGSEICYEPENGYAAEQERILEEAYLQLTELSER